MEETSIQPLSDRVIVMPDEVEQVTPGGIIIPPSAQKKTFRGRVIAAGPGRKDEPITVKPGDIVLHGQYSGTEIELDGKKVLVMRESDILCIL